MCMRVCNSFKTNVIHIGECMDTRDLLNICKVLKDQHRSDTSILVMIFNEIANVSNNVNHTVAKEISKGPATRS